ncbi:hypothetical protein L3Y34_012967 [Caenorhabditis briggsae]|uniref:Uncharacterized protein n=1 Tax=Caenorhabditis briggsae TaxID=6238 RepID=A0AAE9CXA3_CAEBR|nr:hypothetical protein L3Y34_012967 [Caenorhabditis briggsae]
MEKTLNQSISDIQFIKKQLEAKTISDEAMLRKLMDTQNQKIEEHMNEIVIAIKKIGSNAETSEVTKTLQSTSQEFQEKSDARPTSSTRALNNSVATPEVVVLSSPGTDVKIIPTPESNVNGSQQKESREQEEGQTTSLANIAEAVFEDLQLAPHVDKTLEGNTEQSKTGVKRQRAPSNEMEQTSSKFQKRHDADDRDSRVSIPSYEFDYPMDTQADRAQAEKQAENQKSIERDDRSRGATSNHTKSNSAIPEEANNILVNEEVADEPTEDSSDHRPHEHRHDQQAIDSDHFEDHHDELDALPEEDSDQQEEDVSETEPNLDPEEGSVSVKKRKTRKRKSKLTLPRAAKKTVKVFDMEKHDFEWGPVENDAATEYQKNDGKNKIDVFVGKIQENPDEVMKKLAAQSAAYTANGMVRFASGELQCTYDNEKQRRNVTTFLKSHTSAIDPCYLRTTVDLDTYRAFDVDNFRHCQEYLMWHTMQQVPQSPLPRSEKDRQAPTEEHFHQLPTTAINHQAYTLTSTQIAALVAESRGDNN